MTIENSNSHARAYLSDKLVNSSYSMRFLHLDDCFEDKSHCTKKWCKLLFHSLLKVENVISSSKRERQADDRLHQARNIFQTGPEFRSRLNLLRFREL